MKRNEWIWFLFCILLGTGCATISAPSGTVPSRKGLATDPYGGWLTATINDTPAQVQGEFIALNKDSVFVLSGDSLKIIPVSKFNTARIILFNTEANKYSIWTVVLSVATIANGAFATITFPVSLAMGLTTVHDEARREHFFDFPQRPWSELSKYARFPQGLPEELDRGTLKGKPK